MMDARLVWNTWRKALKSDELVAWISSDTGHSKEPDVSAQELEILKVYRQSRAASEINIGMYRRGLVRNARNALRLVPLSRRLVNALGLDVEQLAFEFSRCSGYRDFGPHMWTLAKAFLGFLAEHVEMTPTKFQDVLAIDSATADLALALGQSGIRDWPKDYMRITTNAIDENDRGSLRYAKHPAASLVKTANDVTPWIENPDSYDPTERVTPSEQNYLIYFPDADAEIEIALLSERCSRMFAALDRTSTADDLAFAFGDEGRSEIQHTLEELCSMGVIVPTYAIQSNRPLPTRTCAEVGVSKANQTG